MQQQFHVFQLTCRFLEIRARRFSKLQPTYFFFLSFSQQGRPTSKLTKKSASKDKEKDTSCKGKEKVRYTDHGN